MKTFTDNSRRLANVEFTIEAVKTAPERRSPAMLKALKVYAHRSCPLMEEKYCSTEDYAFFTERLQHKFVKKGHYVIRQGM
jgi:hypothetical protein